MKFLEQYSTQRVPTAGNPFTTCPVPEHNHNLLYLRIILIELPRHYITSWLPPHPLHFAWLCEINRIIPPTLERDESYSSDQQAAPDIVLLNCKWWRLHIGSSRAVDFIRSTFPPLIWRNIAVGQLASVEL